jgi:hypothetical protein
MQKSCRAEVRRRCQHARGLLHSVDGVSFVFSGRPYFIEGQSVVAPIASALPSKQQQAALVASKAVARAEVAATPSADTKRADSKPSEAQPSLTQGQAESQGQSQATDAGWSRSLVGLAGQPEVESLSAGTRAELARQWTADAQAEHASIGSFARFTLQLMVRVPDACPDRMLADR